jgi:hypothetical protein
MPGMGLPEPMATAECNLRGFQWMPLDVVTLIDSELFIDTTGDEFKAALALWCKSWTQVPAGSLPNDERVLAAMSGARRWSVVRTKAMTGWVLCSDGRWHHPYVAEKAMAAFARLQRFQYRINRRLELQSGKWNAIRLAVFERDNYTCTYCSARGVRLEADHVIPVRHGGETTMGNLVTACLPCNRSKGSKTLAEWRA